MAGTVSLAFSILPMATITSARCTGTAVLVSTTAAACRARSVSTKALTG